MALILTSVGIFKAVTQAGVPICQLVFVHRWRRTSVCWKSVGTVKKLKKCGCLHQKGTHWSDMYRGLIFSRPTGCIDDYLSFFWSSQPAGFIQVALDLVGDLKKSLWVPFRLLGPWHCYVDPVALPRVSLSSKPSNLFNSRTFKHSKLVLLQQRMHFLLIYIYGHSIQTATPKH